MATLVSYRSVAGGGEASGDIWPGVAVTSKYTIVL